jgi:YD repeat-containing protein
MDTRPSIVALLPYRGWEAGGEYVLRIRNTAKHLDGRALVDQHLEWVIKVPEDQLPLKESISGSAAAAPRKNVLTLRPFPGGRPWVLKNDSNGLPIQLLDEPTNYRIQYSYGPSGRIGSRDGIVFSYDRAGRRIEDDHFTYRWDWRGRLYSVTVKDQWQDIEGNVITPTYGGHQVWYEYDAFGRLLWRKHLDPQGSLYEKRVFLWEGSCLFAEAAFTDETESSLRWRKTYLPGSQRLDDQVQVHIETFPTSDTEQPMNQTYTFIRDELEGKILRSLTNVFEPKVSHRRSQ